MADIIQLLPDAIANQIAAGEVIQRPASVVKELLENSIDAGGTSIRLIIKDAGKTLIQVMDNGSGMSETDARMCFERHATSKIRVAKDLFTIRSMGFRGEAMASIASIAQVEMKTRQEGEELGTRILIDGFKVKAQEACQCPVGTSISVKNLFFNVPARRNFLKSTTVEMRHILDEFQRVALAHSDIFFSLHHNGTELFHLPPSNLRQRIVNVLGGHTNKKLVPLREETEALTLMGYIGKPEFAKKTRGDQFFFVNNRFIKSGYLSHAMLSAYDELIPKGTHPLYVIFIDINPARIDINVHPTKQEIKFEDERLVYNYLKVTVRHALGQYNISPSLDFEQEMGFVNLPKSGHKKESQKEILTFSSKANQNTPPQLFKKEESHLQQNNRQNWQKLYEGLDEFDEEEDKNESENTSETDTEQEQPLTIRSQWSEQLSIDDDHRSFSKDQKKPYQVHNRYIISQIKSGMMVIDQQVAHERILYEQYLEALNSQPISTQQLLFPKTLTLSAIDATMFKEILEDVNYLGFDVQEFGNNAFVIHGVPANMTTSNEQEQIEQLLEQYKDNTDLHLGVQENVARSLARSMAIKRGQEMTTQEMQALIDKLFACIQPYKGPSGKNCFVTFELDDLQKRFE